MARTLDEILGITKTIAKHNFEVGQRVKTNGKQKYFGEGVRGTVVGFDEWNRLKVHLDSSNIVFPFHHKYVDKING